MFVNSKYRRIWKEVAVACISVRQGETANTKHSLFSAEIRIVSSRIEIRRIANLLGLMIFSDLLTDVSFI
jgi:hypothetical protein